jgi:hypothetical protein
VKWLVSQGNDVRSTCTGTKLSGPRDQHTQRDKLALYAMLTNIFKLGDQWMLTRHTMQQPWFPAAVPCVIRDITC